MSPVGYSGKSLAEKLGVRAGSRVCVEGAELLAMAWTALVECEDVALDADEFDLIHLFVVREDALRAGLVRALERLAAGGAIWVSWPKKASGVATEVTEDTIRAVALPMGLVDIKVCAVTEVWSGLKLVRRKTDGKSRGSGPPR